MLRLILLGWVGLLLFAASSCGSGNNCLSNSDCPAGEFCLDKQCDTVECRTNGDCVGEAFCIEQSCQSKSTEKCISNSDCNNGDCVAGVCKACTPSCLGNCGPDGCGGSCGSCQQGFSCEVNKCVQGCTRSCSGRTCGSDGCGGSCGSCGKGYQCSGSGNCELDPSAVWVITVTKGSISESLDGDSWDFPGGLPDPLVCLKINNKEECTNTVDNTLSPVWNYSLIATTTAIQSGVKAAIYDADVTDYETICSEGLISIGKDDFRRGSLKVQCKYGSFEATLRVK